MQSRPNDPDDAASAELKQSSAMCWDGTRRMGCFTLLALMAAACGAEDARRPQMQQPSDGPCFEMTMVRCMSAYPDPKVREATMALTRTGDGAAVTYRCPGPYPDVCDPNGPGAGSTMQCDDLTFPIYGPGSYAVDMLADNGASARAEFEVQGTACPSYYSSYPGAVYLTLSPNLTMSPNKRQ